MRSAVTTVAVRLHKRVDDRLVRACCEVMRSNAGAPALYNDEIIVQQHPGATPLFHRVQMIINSVAFPIGIALVVFYIWPVVRAINLKPVFARPGEARAFQLARLLEQNEVIVIGSEFPAMVEACHLHAAADMEAAIDLTRWLVGDDLKTLIISHALHTLPVPPTSEPDDWLRVSLVNGFA